MKKSIGFLTTTTDSFKVKVDRQLYFAEEGITVPNLLVGENVEVYTEEYNESLPVEKPFENTMSTTSSVKRIGADKRVDVKPKDMYQVGDVIVYARPRRTFTLGNNNALLMEKAQLEGVFATTEAVRRSANAPKPKTDAPY